MQNTPLEQATTRGSSLLARMDNSDNLLEVMNNSLNNNLLESQKQNIKELKVKPVQKTQRIKKDKKVQKKSVPKEESNKNDVDQFQAELVDDAVDRLRLYLQNPDSYGASKYRGMDEQSLLQFLQLIELQYSETAAIYLQRNINKTMCGNLKGVLSRFVNEILSSFPVLQKLVYYMAVEHYNCGVQQYRFDRLMNKSITPIIHVKSQNYLRVECSEWYLANHTPDGKRQESINKQQIRAEVEEEMDPSFQSEGDTVKVDKKKRKNKKKKEKKDKREDEEFPQPQQRDENFEELIKFLEGMNIKQEERVQCRIEEQLFEHWKGRIGRLMKPIEKVEK